VIVVSRDLTILELARQRNAITLMESDSGLNPAITQAAQWAAHHGKSIVIPVDLPRSSTDLAVIDAKNAASSLPIG
jgi:2-phospho-L-lactate guanylyltransferase (CobY/MobA/RfbA family)